jgi:hydroxyacylglutathione hydrolase
MPITIHRFILGQLGNNSFLIADHQSKEAVVIDPSFSPEAILETITSENLILKQVWITHAHFDHIAGVSFFDAPIGIHTADIPLWKSKGSAENFGINLSNLPNPRWYFTPGEKVQIGTTVLEIRHTPGHSPGHVVFYCESAETVFCGDLIFQGSVGRTDLPGGNAHLLMESIRKQILTLPPQVKLWPGHGEATTVGEELSYNILLR